jgi:zinc/manganese transport system substrate-binding protein
MNRRLPVLLLAVLLALSLCLLSGTAHAVQVVATLPWLGDLTRQVAPDAQVTVLARGNEDPHYLSPTPALMARVGKADLFVENGMNLELWSGRLLDGAGNPRIRVGQPGHVYASTGVPRLQVPTNLSRSQGDLHPAGNPHIWLDPLNIPMAAANIAEGLARVDPAGADGYRQRAAAYSARVHQALFGADLVGFIGAPGLVKLARAGRLDEFLAAKGLSGRLGGWLGTATRGRPVVFYHQSWAYLVDRFDMKVVGYVEDRPGVAPSAGHKARLTEAMAIADCELIAITAYYNDRVAKSLAAGTGARLVQVPGDVGGVPGVDNYIQLMDRLVADLLQ